MKNIIIVHKTGHQPASALAREINCWLSEEGLTSRIIEAGTIIGERPDLAIVLGGDGTILGMARQLAEGHTSILGINFGRVGFLTAADETEWKEAITAVLRKQMPLNSCLALGWTLTRKAGGILRGLAVNDAVLGRGAIARLGNFRIFIDDIEVGSFRCDGIIVGTPLGSSGYAASAGGSIIQNSLDVMNLVPICPFPIKTAPLVFPGNAKIRLSPVEDGQEYFLTIDGQHGFPICSDDSIELIGLPDSVRLYGRRSRFFNCLKKRGLE